VVVVLIDGSEPITEQDQRVLSMVIEAGRALVLAFNKWDLVDEDRRYLLDREIDLQLEQLQWAPRVNISAKTGRAVQDGPGLGPGPGVGLWDNCQINLPLFLPLVIFVQMIVRPGPSPMVMPTFLQGLPTRLAACAESGLPAMRTTVPTRASAAAMTVDGITRRDHGE
jgi:hypothetical protein